MRQRSYRTKLTSLPLLLIAAAAGCVSEAPAPVADRVAPGHARVVAERYAHSIAALGYPGARRSFQVGPGNVVYAGEAAIEWRLLDPDVELRTTPIYFEADAVPVAHWSAIAAGIELRFEAAAVPHTALPDSSLIVSVRVTAHSVASSPQDVTVEARVCDAPSAIHVRPWDSDETKLLDPEWRAGCATRAGLLVACFDGGAAARSNRRADGRAEPRARTDDPGGGLTSTYRATLSTGESRHWDFLLTLYPSSVQRDALELGADHTRAVSTARATWRAWFDQAAIPVTPDSLVNLAYRAALVTLLQCQERFGDDWASMGNPFQYRDIWIRDSARVVRALAVCGLTERARANAWLMRRYQLPSGALLSQRGQLDGTGQALWALAQAASIPPSPEFARRALPVAARALHWIEAQRQATRTIGLPWPGLLPYGHPRDAELVRAQLVGNDAWGVVGCQSVGRLAEIAGESELARRARATRDDYRTTFIESLARTGHPDIPASWQGAGRDWGNLNVGYPTGVLPPSDPRLTRLAARLLDQAGRDGLTIYGTRDSLHTYLGSDLVQWALLDGQSAAARTYVADFIQNSSSTLGQAEIFSQSSGEFGGNFPPHTTAAATFIDLVRNMLVCDVRDTLEVALGASGAWWHGTRLAGAPTRFGTVDLTLARPAAEDFSASWGAVQVPVRIRVPDGFVALESRSAGARVVAGRWIECDPGVGSAAFRARPEGGERR